MITIQDPQDYAQQFKCTELVDIRLFNLSYAADDKIKNIAKQLCISNVKEICDIKQYKHLFTLRDDQHEKIYLQIQNKFSQMIKKELKKCADSPLWECQLPKDEFLHLFQDNNPKGEISDSYFQDQAPNKQSSLQGLQLQDSYISIKQEQSLSNKIQEKFDLRFSIICSKESKPEPESESQDKISFSENFNFFLPKNFESSLISDISVFRHNQKIQVHLFNTHSKEISANKKNLKRKSEFQSKAIKGHFSNYIKNKHLSMNYLYNIANKINKNFEHMTQEMGIDDSYASNLNGN